MIHQHFMLVPTLTVAQNVALGLRSSREPLLDLDKVTKRIQELSDAYGIKVEPRAYVWQLSVGEQQRVEIMKALYRGASLIILDEPTAVLTPQEVNDLFVTLRRMVSEGHSLVFISTNCMRSWTSVIVSRFCAMEKSSARARRAKSLVMNWLR